jgi:hypothetical protein
MEIELSGDGIAKSNQLVGSTAGLDSNLWAHSALGKASPHGSRDRIRTDNNKVP